ncbi:hypothetical protein [Clostridium uliginosum]|uniref:Uncharacterized protein n=1 Tax=Clostridium uliginosum TaxID=119641 RepID=A0A1I1NFL6_9CLOT|nr:hypothetical protein [Clostridium uliginosum]SFC96461.1 hypothetical protein SAMN05421842_11534 [Clostridium uliginosum]
MSKSLLIIKNNTFTYQDNEYLFDEFDEIQSSLSKDRELIILEEELYSKHFFGNFKKKELHNFIENKLNKEFQKNDDILYHYEQDKKNKMISIYSIKGGKRVEILSQEAKELVVKPIQFIIKETMIDLLGKKALNAKLILQFDKSYYYVSLKKGKFYYSFVEKKMDILLNRIHELYIKEAIKQEENKVYVDSAIYDFTKKIYKNFIDKFELISINSGDLLNEKIYKKQKFHFKKVL